MMGFDPYDHNLYEDEIENQFRDPGGISALGVGPRGYACPTCKEPNRLTRGDKAKGYQCDECANREEGFIS